MLPQKPVKTITLHCLFRGHAVFEFTKWLSADVHRLGHLMFANGVPYRFTPDHVERYFQRSLFYGLWPGFFSHNAADNPYWQNPKWYDRDGRASRFRALPRSRGPTPTLPRSKRARGASAGPNALKAAAADWPGR